MVFNEWSSMAMGRGKGVFYVSSSMAPRTGGRGEGVSLNTHGHLRR